TGLPAGATLGGLAMGSDGPGRIDVLLAAEVANADGTMTSTLYNRTSLASAFLASTPVETVAGGSDFSFLRTTNDKTGGVSAYREPGDGQNNDIYSSLRGADGTWSAPAPLTNDHGLKYAPALAVDKDGTLQTVFETKPDPQTGVTINGKSVTDALQ